MRPVLIVVYSPPLDLLLGIFQRHKPVDVQALVPEAAVEGFNVGIVGRLAGSGVVQLDFVQVGPDVERTRDKFRSVVDLDSFGQVSCPFQVIQHSSRLLALNAFIPYPATCKFASC